MGQNRAMSYKTYLAGAPAYGTYPYGATGMLYPGAYGYGYGYAYPSVEDMKKAREAHESMVQAQQAKHQELMEAEKKRYEEVVEARKAALADPACYYGAGFGYGYPGYGYGYYGAGYGYPYGRSYYGEAGAAQRIRARVFY